jgi:GAF domain-containing protein
VVARLILPLQIGERVLGTLNLGHSQPGAFTPEHLPLLSQVAEQMALALERARLLQETQAALEEVEATHRRYLLGEWEEWLGATPDRVWGYHDGPDGLAAAGDAWTPEIERALASGELVITTESARPPGERTDQPTHNALAMPIQLSGQTIGVLDFYDEERIWTEEDKVLVQTLADQVALALENQRLFEQTQRRAQRERLTGEIVSKIRAAGDVQSILETATEELGRTLGVSRALIRLSGPADGPVSGDEDGAG